ncbi:MAG: cytochrome C [Arcobacter sp.]|uniref:cytochrome C n=1 Tax=Arcobacter sp. TaxID=1872629 RepID=UPI003B009B55
MHTSFKKSKVFAFLALFILTISFTIPVVFFHGALNNIHNNKEVSAISTTIWNLYSLNKYVSTNTPKEASNDLTKMIESASEIGAASLPIWSVSLEAPNYPKEAFPMGIPVYFHFDGFTGEVHEMNTINHYIGMDPMWRGGQFEREIAPYALLSLCLIMILFIAYNKKIFSYFMFIPVSLPFLFIADYAYWLYWFGHNLHDWGAFNIKPFMPTVFGDGKVAQFITHSYPGIGFYLLVAISLLSLLAILSRNKAIKESSL